MVEQIRATKKQQILLEFVGQFIREHDYGPSYREIMAALGYKSVSTVAVHVEALIAKGFLERYDNSARSLSVVGHTEKNQSQDIKSDTALELLTKKLDELLAGDRTEDATILTDALRLLEYTDVADSYATKIKKVTKHADA